MDASIVGTQMMYMATELGLGTLWARGYNAGQFHITMGLPEDIRVVFSFGRWLFSGELCESSYINSPNRLVMVNCRSMSFFRREERDLVDSGIACAVRRDGQEPDAGN